MNGPGSSSAQACCRSAGRRPNPGWAGRTSLTLGFAQDADLQVVQRLSAPQVVSVRAKAGLDLRNLAVLDDQVARVVPARQRVFGSYMSPGCRGRMQSVVRQTDGRSRINLPMVSKIGIRHLNPEACCPQRSHFVSHQLSGSVRRTFQSAAERGIPWLALAARIVSSGSCSATQ